MIASWWGITATIAALIGVAVISFALIAPWIKQRITRRRRCPKCWYDMSHSPAPGMRCSECGFTAKRERRLHKARVRRKLTAVGVLMLLLGGYGLHVAPGVRDRGWVAAVPTTVLILGLPSYDSLRAQLIASSPRTANRAPGWSAQDLLFYELMHHRIGDGGGMERFHRRMLLGRCIAGDSARSPLSPNWQSMYGAILRTLPRHPDDEALWQRAEELVDLHLQTRDAWPEGVPIYVQVRLRKWRIHSYHRARVEPVTPGLQAFTVEEGGPTTVRLGRPDGDSRPAVRVAIECFEPGGADLTVNARRLREYRLELPIRIEGTMDDYITPIDDPDIGVNLAAFVAPWLQSNSRVGDFLSMAYEVALPDTAPPMMKETTLGLSLQVLRDGVVVGDGQVCFQPMHHAAQDIWTLRQNRLGVSLTLAPEHAWPRLRASDADASQWSLRVIGSPEVALRQFDATHYWSGTIEIPLAVEFQK